MKSGKESSDFNLMRYQKVITERDAGMFLFSSKRFLMNKCCISKIDSKVHGSSGPDRLIA